MYEIINYLIFCSILSENKWRSAVKISCTTNQPFLILKRKLQSKPCNSIVNYKKTDFSDSNQATKRLLIRCNAAFRVKKYWIFTITDCALDHITEIEAQNAGVSLIL